MDLLWTTELKPPLCFISPSVIYPASRVRVKWEKLYEVLPLAALQVGVSFIKATFYSDAKLYK